MENGFQDLWSLTNWFLSVNNLVTYLQINSIIFFVYRHETEYDVPKMSKERGGQFVDTGFQGLQVAISRKHEVGVP